MTRHFFGVLSCLCLLLGVFFFGQVSSQCVNSNVSAFAKVETLSRSRFWLKTSSGSAVFNRWASTGATITSNTVFNSDCVSDGCYNFSITQLDDEGISGDDETYGYQVKLNNQLITFGRQMFYSGTSFSYFCTSLFSSPFDFTSHDDWLNSTNELLIQTHGVNFDLSIFDQKTGSVLYSNTYKALSFNSGLNGDFETDTQNFSLYLSRDSHCYTLQVGGFAAELSDHFLAITFDNSTTSVTSDTIFDVCGHFLFDVNALQLENPFDDVLFNTRTLGCTTASCITDATWVIRGLDACRELKLSANVVETHYESSSDYFSLTLNNYDMGNCQGGNGGCSHNWIQCADFDELDIFSYVSDNNRVSVQLDASGAADTCPYQFGSENYNFVANVSLICVPRSFRRVSDTQLVGCTSAGCAVSAYLDVLDACIESTLALSVTVMETDYYYSSEYLDVYVDANYLGKCDELNSRCTYDWVRCSIADSLDVSSYVINGQVQVTLDASDYVNYYNCRYYDSSSYTYYYVYANLTLTCVESTLSPTTVAPTPATNPPSPEPTLSPTVYFDVETLKITSSDEFFASESKYVGCVGAGGCSTAIKWIVDGSCYTLKLSVSVVETDFRWECEYVTVTLNGIELGQCDGPSTWCTYDWIQCNNFNLLDISQYISGNIVDIELSSSACVGACPYYHQNTSTSYYMFANVTLTCMTATQEPSLLPTLIPTLPSAFPTMTPSNHLSDSQIVGCTTVGCSVTADLDIQDRCDDSRLALTVSVVETDYSITDSEYLSVSVNGHSLGICDGLDEDCTYDWVKCSNIDKLDVSSYISKDGSISVELYISNGVNICPHTAGSPSDSYYLYANVTLLCIGGTRAPTTSWPTEYPTVPSETPTNKPTAIPTSSPTAMPTMPSETPTLIPSKSPTRSPTLSTSVFLGCTTIGCGVVGSWVVDGYSSCAALELSVSIVETDFDYSYSEYVTVSVNDNYLGRCDGLDSYCTQNWVQCTNFDGLNVLSYMTSNNFRIILDSTTSVGGCYYYNNDDSVYYNLYANVTLTCLEETKSPTRAPTEPPTGVPTDRPTNSPTYSPLNDDGLFVSETEIALSAYKGGLATSYLYIDNACNRNDLRLSVSVVETDYANSYEYVDVSVNDYYLGVCDGLDSYCTHDWVQCTNIDSLQISSLVSSSSSSVKVELDASSYVASCAYLDYYELYARVTLFCAPKHTPAPIYTAPTMAPTGNYFYVSDSYLGGCTWSGCSISTDLDVSDSCENDDLRLSVKIMETDFDESGYYSWSENEYVDVTINGYDVGTCEGLDEECTLDWVQCTNIDQLQIPSYMISDTVSVTLDSSSDVDECAYYVNYNYYYLYANITLFCFSSGNPSTAVSPQTTLSIDQDASGSSKTNSDDNDSNAWYGIVIGAFALLACAWCYWSITKKKRRHDNANAMKQVVTPSAGQSAGQDVHESDDDDEKLENLGRPGLVELKSIESVDPEPNTIVYGSSEQSPVEQGQETISPVPKDTADIGDIIAGETEAASEKTVPVSAPDVLEVEEDVVIQEDEFEGNNE